MGQTRGHSHRRPRAAGRRLKAVGCRPHARFPASSSPGVEGCVRPGGSGRQARRPARPRPCPAEECGAGPGPARGAVLLEGLPGRRARAARSGAAVGGVRRPRRRGARTEAARQLGHRRHGHRLPVQVPDRAVAGGTVAGPSAHRVAPCRRRGAPDAGADHARAAGRSARAGRGAARGPRLADGLCARPSEPMPSWLANRVAALPAPALVRDRYYEDLGISCRLASGPGTPDSHDGPVRRRAGRVPAGADATPAAGPARRGRHSADAGPRRHARRSGSADRTGARRHGDAPARSRRLRVGRPARRAARRLRRRPAVRRDRERAVAPVPAREHVRTAHVEERRADRLRAGERSAAVRRGRLQRVRDLPRRRGRARLRPPARDDAVVVRRAGVHHPPLPARGRQRRRARLRRVVVLLQAGVQAADAPSQGARRPRGRADREGPDVPDAAAHPGTCSCAIASTGRRRRSRAATLVEPLRLDRIGLAVTRTLAERFGGDRERATQVCSDEVADSLGRRRTGAS